jgi:hypothetical protein
VNLRYPSAGETSGTLIRAFDAGKPVAVSDYAQFAELPDDCVVKIPLGDREIDSLADFFLRELPDPSAAQKRWLDQNARLDLTAQGYLQALSVAAGFSRPDRLKPVPTQGSIPMFPKLEVVSATDRTLTIRNTGDTTLRARVYGEPAYRLIVNHRWIDLPRDLEPRQTAEISLPSGGIHTAVLRHGLQGIPMLEAEAWGRATIQ